MAAVSLSTSHRALPAMPIAYRLYLPEIWAQDQKRRKKASVPEQILVCNQAGDCPRTDSPKRWIDGVTAGAVVLADAAYGG